MASNLISELAEFHQFVGERLRNGGGDLSPEDALDQWRAEHPSAGELDESVAAVRQALADMDAGDCGRPADVVTDDIRRRLAGPSQP